MVSVPVKASPFHLWYSFSMTGRMYSHFCWRVGDSGFGSICPKILNNKMALKWREDLLSTDMLPKSSYCQCKLCIIHGMCKGCAGENL